MNEARESRFTKARLEAFSDGVIAVIITIMVLDLKAPEDDSLNSFMKLWPAFLAYAISFVFAAIYWINHHHIIATVRRVTAAVIWSNNVLLFFLSLFPFATAYMAATRMSPFPTMIYGVVQLCCAFAFGALSWIIDQQQDQDAVLRQAKQGGIWKGRVSQVLYALAIPAAYFNPAVSIAIFVTIAILYTVPDLLARQAPGKMR
jgi:uncharacterized membrane protein